MNTHSHRGPIQSVLLALGVAAAYFVAARLGLGLAFMGHTVTLVWPPTVVALTALLIFGYRILPGLVIGALAANLSQGSPLLFSAVTAVGNPLEAVVGAWLLRRLPNFDPALSRVRDVVALIVVGTVLSPPFSATLGVAGLCLSNQAPWSGYGHVWPRWCLGDGMGVLLFAPALLPWNAGEARRRVWERWIEFLALLILLTGAAIVVFFSTLATAVNYLPLPYFLLPLLLVMTIRFGSLGAGVAVAVTSAIAVASTGSGMGPFAEAARQQVNIASLLAFMCMIAIVCLILGAMLAEREKSERMLQAANERVNAMNSELEQRVQTRTRELEKAKVQLEAGNALQNAVLSAANYAVISVTTDGVVTSFNPTAERWLGYTASEAIGKMTPVAWHDPGEVARRAQVVSRVLGRQVEPGFEAVVALARQGQPDSFESVFVRKDDSRFPVRLSISAMKDPSGAITGFVGVIADITLRKQAEEKLRESEERSRLIVESVADCAIFMLDIEGHVATWNAGAERIHGYKAEEIIGKHFSIFYPPKSVEAGKPDRLLHEALAGGSVNDEGWRVRKSGSWFYGGIGAS